MSGTDVVSIVVEKTLDCHNDAGASLRYIARSFVTGLISTISVKKNEVIPFLGVWNL
jgi:hypothetical protein